MVVAVLTVFGLTHDLSEPSAIPIFLGSVTPLPCFPQLWSPSNGELIHQSCRYFTIIYWVWASQVFYDNRYECKSPAHLSILGGITELD